MDDGHAAQKTFVYKKLLESLSAAWSEEYLQGRNYSNTFFFLGG